MYLVKVLNFIDQFFINGLGVFMAAVDIEETEGLYESVYSTDSMFFVIKFGTGLAEKTFVEAELIEAEVLDWVFIMSGDFAKILFGVEAFRDWLGLGHF